MTTAAQHDPRERSADADEDFGPVPNGDWSTHRSRDAALWVETTDIASDSATVRVTGELDLGTAAPLWAVLRSHLAAGRRFLRLDVSALAFLDATALTGIHQVHADALAARGTLVITGVRGLVARILQMSGLDEVLFVGGPRTGADIDEFGRVPRTGARASVPPR